MPEGDAVWRTADRLHRALVGQVLVQTDFRWPQWATTDFAGATTLEVRPRGKHILHRLDTGWTIHTHLRMEGRWRVVDQPVRAPGPQSDVRVVLATARHLALGVKLGMVDIVRTADEHTLVGHLGPDPLAPDWDIHRAIANLRGAGERPIGAALLDQRLIAGIGTMWDAETLWTERVDPWTPVADLPDATLAVVVARAARLLRENRDNRTAPDTAVHGRAGRPCRRCRTPIRIEMIGDPPQDRTMFHCPTCQHVTYPPR